MIVFVSKNLQKTSLEFAEDCVEQYCYIARQSKISTNSVLSKRPKVLKDENGRPYIDGGLFISISHTSADLSKDHNMIAVAISTKPAGVDIEISRLIDWQKISSRYFNEEEQKKINSARDFFKFWTRKEALFKAIRDQKSFYLPKINTLDKTNLHTYDIFENVILSVCSEDNNIYFCAI